MKTEILKKLLLSPLYEDRLIAGIYLYSQFDKDWKFKDKVKIIINRQVYLLEDYGIPRLGRPAMGKYIVYHSTRIPEFRTKLKIYLKDLKI